MSSSILETDFPITNSGGVISRTHSRERNSIIRGSSYTEQQQQQQQQHRNSSNIGVTNYPPAYTRSSSATPSDWRYQSATGSPIDATPVVVVSTGRSGSLRKAYSDSSSAGGGGGGANDAGEEQAETDPLYPNNGSNGRSKKSGNKASVVKNGSQHVEIEKMKEKKKTKTKKKRHRKHDEDSLSPASRCCFGFLILVAQILLNGVMALVLYWTITYHSYNGQAFAWRDDPKLEFNLHPVLMIAGFIYFMGQSMLLYRTCRCCRRIWNKLLHTVFHILAIPCIAIAFIAVLDSHNLRLDKDGNPAPIPNFYSLHSWMGLTTMGLFCMQFIVGFFSFLLLLCCESGTAAFRASLVPIHSTFGISTFVLAVATACAGFTEKAFFTLSIAYSKWIPYMNDRYFNGTAALSGTIAQSALGSEYTHEMFAESLTINVLVALLCGLIVVVPLIVNYPKFRYRPQRVVAVTHDRYG